MELDRLEMRREPPYSPDSGMFKGVVKFTSPKGEVTVALDHEKCVRILIICADGMLETVGEVARTMRADIIPGERQLENKAAA